MPNSRPQLAYTARLLNPAHPDLANGAGVPAQLANEASVEALARVVFYWAYPLLDAFGRTSSWELMKDAGRTTSARSASTRMNCSSPTTAL